MGTLTCCREFVVQVQIVTLLPQGTGHEFREKIQVGCLFKP